jgi:uncharacterized protein YkwD
MRYLVSPLLLLAFLLVTAPPPRLAGQPPQAMPGLTKDEQKFLELTNAERVRVCLPPLKFNSLLSKVARAHSENMAKQGKMDHKLDGKDQYKRIKDAGYRYRYAGENVARGKKRTTEQMLEALMKSKGHRENILRKEFTELGVGLAVTEDGVTYYTQVFGDPKPLVKKARD